MRGRHVRCGYVEMQKYIIPTIALHTASLSAAGSPGDFHEHWDLTWERELLLKADYETNAVTSDLPSDTCPF